MNGRQLLHGNSVMFWFYTELWFLFIDGPFWGASWQNEAGVLPG
jgi:hypothetical protein